MVVCWGNLFSVLGNPRTSEPPANIGFWEDETFPASFAYSRVEHLSKTGMHGEISTQQ